MKRTYTIQDMHDLAAAQGGRCLSNEYLGMNTQLEWQCANGHRWKTIPNVVRRGGWCGVCAGNVRKTVEDMRQLAASYGGSFLSDKYKGKHDKYLWSCEVGHRFRKKAHDVANGSWCPNCADFKSERLTRAIFESVFGELFPTRRPSWLRNDRGNRMELDGYCEKLKLAFEYQGRQHYEKDHFFHASDKSFSRRLADDIKKAQLCEKHGVVLVQVPYNRDQKQIARFIVRECRNQKIPVDNGWSFDDLDLATAYSPKILAEIKKFAEKKGGRCLSDKYVSATSRMKWRCHCGYEWPAPWHRIQKGHWCPKCSGRAKRTIEEMQAFAESKGGRFISERYVRMSDKYTWECAEGHRWDAAAQNVIHSGSWCPECYRLTRRTIEDVQKYAQSKNGKFISEVFTRMSDKHTWECAEGHRWDATPSNVLRGSWCSECNKNAVKVTTAKKARVLAKKKVKAKKGVQAKKRVKAKQRVAELRTLAESKGGRLISKVFTRMADKYTWECAEGHRWNASASDVFYKGRWCGECFMKKLNSLSKTCPHCGKICNAGTYAKYHGDKCRHGK